MCRGGSCEKIGISALKTAKEGVSRILKYKKEHSEIKQFGNNNNSVPKSKSILNKFEKGEVLRWSLRKKNPAAHTVPTCYCCVETLFKTRKKTRLRKRKEKKNKKKTGHHTPDNPPFQQFYHGYTYTSGHADNW